MEKLIVFVLAVFGVLQIILFFKLWRATDDIKALKDHFVTRPANERDAHISTYAESKDIKVGDANGITYKIINDYVEFADGVNGRIICYPGYPEVGVLTDDNFELLYNDINFACSALHQYKLNKTERQTGLYEKRKK